MFFNKKEATTEKKEVKDSSHKCVKRLVLERNSYEFDALPPQHIKIELHSNFLLIDKDNFKYMTDEQAKDRMIDIEISEAILLRDFLIYALDGEK